MKLIIAGATGFVGTEIVRQAISHPAVTSIVALARRETILPPNKESDINKIKFESVVCEDFAKYPEAVKQKLTGADTCIWLIAVTPSQLSKVPFGEARKICLDYTMTGLETISQLPHNSGGRPLRFIYTSGAKSERDQNKKPWVLGDYSLMRGETENRVLAYAQQSKGAVEACVAKPGLIDSPGRTSLIMKAMRTVGCSIIGLPQVDVREVAAALLDQAVKGFEKDTLLNEDLVKIGRQALFST